MSNSNTNRFTGILAGWDEIIRDHYNLQHAVTTKTAARDAYQSDSDLPALFSALFAQMERNLSPTPSPSIGTSNWNLRHALDISDKNESLEKLLEKRVVSLSAGEKDASPSGDWFNQVPAGSGYTTSASNRKSSIDLVYRKGKNEYAVIELKVCNNSGTPFYATYENLSYGFLYLLTRTNDRLKLIFADAVEKPILSAEKIQLVILAPKSYYEENKPFYPQLKRFERKIQNALTTFVRAKLPELNMGFKFIQFTNPVSSVEEIERFMGFEPGPLGQQVPFEV